MHLQNLNFSNFKNWKHFDTDLRKINLFFGQNSSGKSSIIQLLLLLKQTVENSDDKVTLFYGDDKSYVNLGNFDEILNRDAVDKIFSFGFSFKEFVFYPLRRFYFALQKNENGIVEVNEMNSESVDEGIKLNVKKSATGYELNILGKNNPIPKFQIAALKYFYELPYRPTKIKNIDDQLFSHQYALERLFEKMVYIGPLREYPRREYKWTGSRHSHFGKRGENTIDAMITSFKQDEKYHSKYFDLEASLAEIVCKWLIDFDMADDFQIQPISEEKQLYQVNIKTKGAKNWVDICDVGFGVSQLLPIIALGYYVPEDSIIILEQPEIHLHPKVQSGLGDFMIDVALSRNTQFIVESHSEHFLTRIQRRIAENYIDEKDVKINFCKLEEGESKLEDLKMNEYGEIANWPKNFFGDEMEEIYQMQIAILKRKEVSSIK
jgi:predicted ATPase